MRHLSHVVALLAGISATTPLSARGQGATTLLLGAGMSAPVGVLHSYAATGFALAAGAEWRLGQHPVALRVDVTYAVNADSTDVGIHNAEHLTAGFASVVYHFLGARPRLYAIAGVGLLSDRFTTDDPFDSPTSTMHAAMQVGEGVVARIGRAAVFLEGRFVTSFGPDRLAFFPVIVGLRLGGLTR